MIKEYFTDGLLGLAILLSLLRTDLVGINNLINYPEVQDIILGQTAAYLPANFHFIQNSPQAFGNAKHLDFDNDAFSAWYHNINNLPLYQEQRKYEVQTFLVNSHQPTADDLLQSNYTSNTVLAGNNSAANTSQTLPSVNDISFVEDILLSVISEGQSSTDLDAETTSLEGTSNINVSLFFNSPFPGCDLTKEDLNLIDILYQQDVDLGVGKEVFDPAIREELDRERQLEFNKEQERQKAHLLALEKKEREKRELQDTWLKTNFRRDGETGEWVKVHNETAGSSSHLALKPNLDYSKEEDAFTLEEALDFLGNLQRDQNEIANDDVPNNRMDSVLELPTLQFGSQEQEEQVAAANDDNFHKNWSDFVDYLNMSANNLDESIPSNSIALQQQPDEINSTVGLSSDFALKQDLDFQKDYLIQNITMPSVDLDNLYPDLNVLAPMDELESSLSHPLTNNSTLDLDFDDLNFLGSSLQNETTNNFDLDEVNHLLSNIEATNEDLLVDKSFNLADSMDDIQMLQERFHSPLLANGNTSPFFSFAESFDALETESFAALDGSEPFDVLEGATGGSDYNSSYKTVNDHLSKISRLSESSNDSGFVNQGAFSSSSSTPSYTGSPAGSHNGIDNSTSSNDTENDPHGTHTIAKHRVAHNHTYNTLPGQIPREVKKYAQKEPSRKGPHNRDQRRANELKIPFVIEDIIESPVETFNEMLTKHKLNEAQLSLIRDIRRRGKNKVAAQNCRKRKVGVIFTLTDEMAELQKMRDRLVAERVAMDHERRKMKEKFGHLYTHIFQSLRDEHGEPYDPSLYSLQQSSDGDVFLVPRNVTINKSNQSSSSSSNETAISKKRKSYDH